MPPGFRNHPKSLWAVALLLFLPAGLVGQTPSITLNSATLTIDPQSLDGYTLQGTFSGLSFTNAQTVSLNVGQFAGSIDIGELVQQPGTNVYIYQDSTGLAPSWFTSLTLNLDAQTFSAQAAGIVLAGLANPFAVQFGTDSAAACTMARVQSTGQTTWQLSPGDGVQEPCSIPAPPLASPPTVMTNTPTTVQFQVAIQTTANLDPTTVQLFHADSNGQPTGSAVCTLAYNGAASSGGTAAGSAMYSCSASFTESTLGLIPLLVQASAPPNRLLSPSFSLLVVQQESQDDVDAFSAVSGALNSAWQQNYAAYGDSAEARIRTLSTLRNPAMPGVAQLALLDDGLSIGVWLTSGLPYSLTLNRIEESQVSGRATGTLAPVPVAASRPAGIQPAAVKVSSARSTAQTVSCGAPQRPVVQNNKVMIWKSPFFPEPTVATLLQRQLQAVDCPAFEITSVDSSLDAAMNFPEYGTIIIDTHGGARFGDVEFLTDTVAAFPVGSPNWNLIRSGKIGSSSVPFESPDIIYITLKSEFFASLGPFQNTVTFASTCWSGYGNVMANIFAANGGAYYGFTTSILGTLTHHRPGLPSIVVPGFSERIGPPLFDELLSNYANVTEADQAVDHEPLPSETLSSQVSAPGPKGIFKVSNGEATFVLQTQTSDLAYLGNPQLSAPGQTQQTQPYFVPILSSLGLEAHLDGASSCSGIMNMNWTNTAALGHLTPVGGGSGQDNFSSTSGNAAYTALGFLPVGLTPLDNITVDFLPNPRNPTAAAQACATVSVLPDQILNVVFTGQGQSSYTTSSGYTASANLSWTESWDVHIPLFQGTEPISSGGLLAYITPALAGTSVTGTTSVSFPIAGVNCQGPPVFGGITAAPYMGVGAQNPTSNIAFPIVPMFVEAFGGGVYHLCDGGNVLGIGEQVIGYPGWDPNTGMYLFNLDLSQFLGKTTTVTMPVSGSFQAGPDDPNTGSVSYSGTLTFSTTAACDPSTQSCPGNSPTAQRQSSQVRH